jgi:hypothetical protein
MIHTVFMAPSGRHALQEEEEEHTRSLAPRLTTLSLMKKGFFDMTKVDLSKLLIRWVMIMAQLSVHSGLHRE